MLGRYAVVSQNSPVASSAIDPTVASPVEMPDEEMEVDASFSHKVPVSMIKLSGS